MNLKYPEPLSPEAREAFKQRGGLCHRLPWSAPVGMQNALSGEPDMLVLHGFGACQKDLCPMWWDEEKTCLDRAVALQNSGIGVRLASLPPKKDKPA